MPPLTSIVLPSYQGAPLAMESVAELRSLYGDDSHGSWEVIVVDDGGGDFPADAWKADPDVRLISFARNHGKGAALRAGLEAARGRARIYTDADLPYGSAVIPILSHYLRHGSHHLVIGDRQRTRSAYYDVISRRRRFTTRLGSVVIRHALTGGFFDTQCGLKGIRGDIADALVPRLKIDRFAFDAELIYVALIHCLDIKRIPVKLRRDQPSTVHLVRDTARFLIDIGRIRWHCLRGNYRSPELVEILGRDLNRD